MRKYKTTPLLDDILTWGQTTTTTTTTSLARHLAEIFGMIAIPEGTLLESEAP